MGGTVKEDWMKAMIEDEMKGAIRDLDRLDGRGRSLSLYTWLGVKHVDRL